MKNTDNYLRHTGRQHGGNHCYGHILAYKRVRRAQYMSSAHSSHALPLLPGYTLLQRPPRPPDTHTLPNGCHHNEFLPPTIWSRQDSAGVVSCHRGNSTHISLQKGILVFKKTIFWKCFRLIETFKRQFFATLYAQMSEDKCPGPLLLTWIIFNPSVDEFGSGWVIPPHILLGMWLLIHTGIKLNPCW